MKPSKDTIVGGIGNPLDSTRAKLRLMQNLASVLDVIVISQA